MQQLNENKFIYKASPNSWALDLMQLHEEDHWLPGEVPMMDDIRDWKERAAEGDKAFIQELMLFFTQADVEVSCTYLDEYLPMYKNDLSIRMMLSSFAARENIHILAYAHLVESLGLGDGVFSQFKADTNLMALHDALNQKWSEHPVRNRFMKMCANSLLGEGTMLFGQFAMLLNFQRWNLFSAMCTIVAWSIRDEDKHVEGIAKLMKHDPEFNELSVVARQSMYDCVKRSMLPLIVAFAKRCFEFGQPKGITFEEVVQFLEFQSQRRARQANIQEAEISVQNPFPWFDQLIGGIEDANFFERRRTEYSKNNLVGDWEY